MSEWRMKLILSLRGTIGVLLSYVTFELFLHMQFLHILDTSDVNNDDQVLIENKLGLLWKQVQIFISSFVK